MTALIIFTNSRQPWYLVDSPHDGDHYSALAAAAHGQLWERLAEFTTEIAE